MPRRTIDTKIWGDNWFINLDPLERYLFIYFITNEHTELCGIYELPLKIMAFESGLDVEMLNKIIIRFSSEKKVFYTEGWISVSNYEKYQVMNPNMKTNADKSEESVPLEIREIFKQLLNSSELLANSNGTLLSKHRDKYKLKDKGGVGGKGLKVYGRNDINEAYDYLRKKLGGSPDGSQEENRRFAKLLIDKLKKDYPDSDTGKQIIFLIDKGLEDSFHGKNITSFKYLYYNVQKIIQSVKKELKSIAIIK